MHQVPENNFNFSHFDSEPPDPESMINKERGKKKWLDFPLISVESWTTNRKQLATQTGHKETH